MAKMMRTALLVLATVFLLAASVTLADDRTVSIASISTNTTTGNSTSGSIKPPTVAMTPGLAFVGSNIEISSDATGFSATGGLGGYSTFTARIVSMSELTPAGGVVQKAAIAFGAEQDITQVPPFDKDIIEFEEYSQSMGIATPIGASFAWDLKQFTMQKPLESVSGSHVFILMEPGNVHGGINIAWPVKNYTNHFQICSLINWSISTLDWMSFINNITLPGQKPPASPPIDHTMRKNNQATVVGFTLDGSFSFGYMWPGPAGFVFDSKNPWTLAGHSYYANINVTFTDAKWTQDGGVTVCVNTDRTGNRMMFDLLIDADGSNSAAGLVPPFIASLLLAALLALSRHLY